MSEVVDIRQADDPRDVIHRAVRLLAEGQLVALPTETVYVIVAQSLLPQALEKLRKAGENRSKPPYALMIKGADEVRDFVPNLSRLGRKMTRRCWPGPVTFSLEIEPNHGLIKAMPDHTQEAAVSSNYVRFRAPAHPTVRDVLKLVPAPLIMLDETLADTPPLATADKVEALFGDDVALIIDDGPCRYKQAAAEVRIANNEWELLQPGVVTESMLRRLASEVYLFVCTGNTCRSPMAEGLFRKLLAERLQCSEDELFDRGYVVISAGLAAPSGYPASPEAVDTLASQGVDLRGHESQPLTDSLLDHADHIFTMTRYHRDTILASRPDSSERVSLLSRNTSDIADPIGGGIEDYIACEREIQRHVRSLLEEIVIN